MPKSSDKTICERLHSREAALAVIGLGYVGLPAARAFARRFRVVGYDIDTRRIETLRTQADDTQPDIRLTAEERELDDAALYIVAVPTPVDRDRRPDLEPLLAATRCVARHLKRGDCVVFESTVHPGCTEQRCIPLLEEGSGLRLGRDFKVGYSPERINPGDPSHTFISTPKIVSANDAVALDAVAGIYGAVIEAPIHRAPSIRVAEAAKMLENAQRNVNIALMNELSALFAAIGLETSEVIAAAATKWNFVDCHPGLVGGHCIPVDPLYLIDQAAGLGVELPLLRSSCAVNKGMARRIAGELLARLPHGRSSTGARALVMGIAYKENSDDIRNTLSVKLIRELERGGAHVDAVDPLVDPRAVKAMYGIDLKAAPEGPYDLIVVTVGHDCYKELDEAWFRTLARGKETLLADLGWVYKGRIRELGYWTL